MKISGPFFDKSRRQAAKKWWLSYFVPKMSDGKVALVDGKPVMERKRPYYATQEAAQADKPRILSQHHSSGTGSGGVVTRDQVADLERAKAIAPEVTLADLAQFWRLHHPLQAVKKLAEHVEPFLADVEARLGRKHQRKDLKARVGALCRRFGERLPATITRGEALDYLKGLQLSGRTIRNHKAAACTFFNYLVEQEATKTNPFAGIKKRQLPREEVKEIGFLALAEAESYLRALERYDPDLVAHEAIQLLAGVRADDEMANFRGEWVIAKTREVVIPAAIAKMDRRAVINTLEESFWAWWRAYGREGILRPESYRRRWRRARILATLERPLADELAALPLQTLLKRTEAAALKGWPWNARRRTFCTYHVAKYQSADRTALILRQIGGTETLHNSYRGLGVTQQEGEAYFEIQPRKVAKPIGFDQARRRHKMNTAARGESGGGGAGPG